MSEDLKWLAENVHEWKHSDCDLIRRHDMTAFYYGETRNHLYPREEYYTRTQWQAARDELTARKEWRGPEDGLPPVGIECSILGTESGSWADGVIDYIDSRHCIWHWSGEKTTMHNHVVRMQFRPFRTEEDKAVEDMLALDCDPCEGMLSREDFCRRLYQHGFRKQELK